MLSFTLDILVVFTGLILKGAHAACPGPLGDAFCQSFTSKSGFCEPGRWTCSGTNVACGCDFRTPTTAATPSFSPVIQTTFGRPGPVVATTRSSVSQTNLIVRSSTSTTPPAIVTRGVSQCGTGPSRALFIWAEWPSLNDAAAYSSYFAKLLAFIGSNCGNFGITKLILRVMDPFTSGLSIISETSSLFTDFLAIAPPNLELRLYPYLLDASAQSLWSSYSATGSPLEGVFKYAADWNTFLAAKGKGIRFGGIVVDGEEKKGFIGELSSVVDYKSKYSIPRFGVAIGFDTVSSISQYPSTDEFYLEMYDFYVTSSPTLSLIQNSPNQTPADFLATLDQNTLSSIVSKYTDPRFQFMWSVQARSGSACFYPLGSACGTKDDFGVFSAADFGTFLDLAMAKYPQLSGKNHGIFQFSFLPKSWA